MKRKLFESMCALSLVLLALTLGLFYLLSSDWTSRIWMVIGLAMAAVVASLVLASCIMRSVRDALQHTRLEDVNPERLYVELRPLVNRILEENHQMQKQLQKQGAERKREYEKQDRMRRDFTANVSHELKTPLTSISGYAEIIRDGMVRQEDVGRFAGKIYDEAQRMIALVEDILKLSQLDEGHRIPVERVPVDLYALCETVIGHLQAAAEQRGIVFALHGQSSYIIGVGKIAEEIIYNLCDNAIKYNRPGGNIDVSVEEEDERVILSVRDTGIGISPEEQERVFERFYRVDKSHSKEIGGTGLGLSIVKHGALYHDARIELHSVPGEGSTFRVLFQKELPQSAGR